MRELCKGLTKHFVAAGLIGSLISSANAQTASAPAALGQPTTAASAPPDFNGQATAWPSPDWPSAVPEELGIDSDLLDQAEQYALSAGGSGMIIYRGQALRRWGDQQQLYDIKSATKSFGATMLGVAIEEGEMELHAPASRYHPKFGIPPKDNETTGWLKEISLFHLVTQTAGFEKRGGYEKILFKPGTQWHYSDGGPNWLAECITLQYGRDLEDLMFERVFTPLGITRDDLRWRDNQYRDHEINGIPRREFGAGIHCNVEALSRLGYLYLRQGRWRDQQILTEDFVRMASQPLEALLGLPEWSSDAHGNASDHYSLLWWNNADGALANVPRDAYWAWGLYDSLIVVIPSLETVVVRAGARGKNLPRKEGQNHYEVLQPLLGPIVAAVSNRADQPSAPPLSMRDEPPYLMSDVITNVEWAPKEEIIRLAKGSDNWPITWADDGHLYSAYGDGWGFQPMVEEKLSLGLVRVEGTPPDVRGINVRSPGAERSGQGKHGEKASGMLMVDGTLYMFVRNAGNSQLGWSDDHGKSWTWADWKFTTSFGCPTFLNFGKNFAGARDEFVYIYSPDSASAYEPADRMVLARVGKNQLNSRDAYEFFERMDENGKPVWTRNAEQRGAVFVHPGSCYRSGVTYNSGLKRYLWCQILPQSEHPQGQRFQGGFGIYEAPEPWGPWRTVYFTRNWDVGPGETSRFPTKWMSDDGQTMHLVFSGDDYFSVRKARLSLGPSTDPGATPTGDLR